MPQRRGAPPAARGADYADAMPTGWIADDGEGGAWAYVEQDVSGPFTTLNGPAGVSVEEAIAWARRHADRIFVRIGGKTFSAGVQRAPDLPSWPDAEWRVEATSGWFRSDGATVAGRLAEKVQADARASDVEHSGDPRTIQVAFTLLSAGEVEANEIAFDVIRTAWQASGIVAEKRDFDASAISVSLVGRASDEDSLSAD